jgi:hypothetical protein
MGIIRTSIERYLYGFADLFKNILPVFQKNILSLFQYV